MERGETVLLKRGKKRYQCEVIHDHSMDDPPFPAVTVKRGRDEWIVGAGELTTPLATESQLREEFKQSKLVPEILAAYEGGAKTLLEIATKLGVQACYVVSKFRKAQRLGLLPEKGNPNEQN
jgi:hypothetical protein